MEYHTDTETHTHYGSSVTSVYYLYVCVCVCVCVCVFDGTVSLFAACGLSLIALHGFLIVVASIVAEHKL